MNREKQLLLIRCREADETACICSEVEELSLKSKRIWDVVSQVFQTIFQPDLVNTYGALHCLMSEILKKKERGKYPTFPYWHSGN